MRHFSFAKACASRGAFFAKKEIAKFSIKKALTFLSELSEATIGFEPMNQGVADPCLTTWLCRLIIYDMMKHLKMFHHLLAPRVGLEPTTPRLTAVCSTIELSRNS